jgi:HEAT repeat protein
MRQSVVKHNKAQAEKNDQEFAKLQKDLDNSDPQVRATAIGKVLYAQDPRLIPVIRALLADPEARTRSEAILALYRLHAEGVADEVGKLIADPDSGVRHTAAEYGRQLGYKSTLDEVRKFQAAKDWNSQSIAMHLAQSLPPEEAVPVLAEFLDHEEAALRKRAVWALTTYDAKWIQPYAIGILRLAGDSDGWVRGAVQKEERKLQSLVSVEELRKLAEHGTPEVQAMAFRMLRKKGVDVAREMIVRLSSPDPVLRKEALDSFASKQTAPEKEIVAMLDDPDSYVRSSALYAVDRLQLKSAVPKLQELVATADRYTRKHAARSLLKMDEPLWPPSETPKVSGPWFETAAKIAGGDKKSLATLLDEADRFVDRLSKMKDFPCDRAAMFAPKKGSELPLTTRGPGDGPVAGRLGGHTISHVKDSVVVAHGNLAVNGYIHTGLVIVTGDLYVHEGYIYNSIVLVQGRIVCEGYFHNSIVIAGRNESITLDDGYISDSIAAAGTIQCNGHYSHSLLGGKLSTDSSGRTDLRESNRFDPTPIYADK